ncbi:MAG: M56 family metallopeptidase [Oscillospiraceae bacterium]|nr:M56 family metallopeptidase [Oscillospiraceae bacterium]
MGLESLFLALFNRSIAAGWLILAVIVLRPLLVKVPKRVRVWLWGLVGFRLAVPVSLQSVFSLIPSAQTVPENMLYEAAPAVGSGIERLDTAINSALQQAAMQQAQQLTSIDRTQALCIIAGVLWLLGIAVLLLYSVGSTLRLRHTLRYAVRLHTNIWQSEAVEIPFVFGLLHPRVYLPFSMEEETRYHVLAHEFAHIRRGDHIVKAVGWLLVCIYWFHPLVWVAYTLLCKDIELACDEHVLRTLDAEGKKAYSHALLEQSTEKEYFRPGMCPLAFSEGGIRGRIRNILRYKKPAVWSTVICIALCVIVAVCFLTDPVVDADPAKVVGPYDITGLRGDFLHSGDEAYAVGANAYGMPVFEDHRAAYSAFLQDYSRGIEEVRTAWKLDSINKRNYSVYKTYGWQTPCADEELNRQCYQVTLFFDLYENSFEKTAVKHTKPTLPSQMDTDLSDEIAQLPQVLSVFSPDPSLDSGSWPTEAAVQFIPTGAQCTDVSSIGEVTYIDYRYNGYRYLTAYHASGYVEMTITEADAWSPGGGMQYIVNSTAPGKVKQVYATNELLIQKFTGGEFLGMSIGLSYMPEDGSYYESIQLCGDRLTVMSSEGQMLYDGVNPVKSSYSHGALLSMLAEEQTGIPKEEIPAYKHADEMAVYSWYEYGSEQPAYSIWCFHGKPTWFAEREALRIYKLEPAW